MCMLHDMDHTLERLARQHWLGPRLPRGHGHPSSGPRPVPVPPPPPDPPLPASLLTPNIPFCLPCFSAYIQDGLPCSSPLEGGCGCCVAHMHFAGHAQCASGPQAKTMKKEEECYFCDSKTSMWTRVTVTALNKFQPGCMWVVACIPCQAAFRHGYPPSSLYTWDESYPRAKGKDMNANESVCTSCWLAKGKCRCKYPSIYKHRQPFIKHQSNSARGGPRSDPPPKNKNLHMALIHDAVLGSL